MEENLRHQLETTFSTCRRSPRVLERTLKETPTTVKKVLVEKTIYPENPVAENTKNSFGFGDSPEGNID